MVAVERFNKRAWIAYKRSLGLTAMDSNSLIPGFCESLNSLHNDHGYGITDIGVMFGVSRMRVRQWFDQYGIPYQCKRGTVFREWDDNSNRFTERSSKQIHQAYSLVKARNRKQLSEAALMEKKAKYTQILKELNDELGRPPTLIPEFQNRIGCVWQNAARLWKNGSWAKATRLMYQSAGLEVRHAGGLGHRAYDPSRKGLRGPHHESGGTSRPPRKSRQKFTQDGPVVTFYPFGTISEILEGMKLTNENRSEFIRQAITFRSSKRAALRKSTRATAIGDYRQSNTITFKSFHTGDALAAGMKETGESASEFIRQSIIAYVKELQRKSGG